MGRKTARCWAAGLAFVACLGLVRSASAEPTGLNNIPTTDVVPEKILVLQGKSDFGHTRNADFLAGFKFGAWKDLEVSLDQKVGDNPHRDPAFQAKYRIDPGEALKRSSPVSTAASRCSTETSSCAVT